MGNNVKVIVTGEHEITEKATVLPDGRTVEWQKLSLLNFEPIPVEKEFLESVVLAPFNWIIFTSPRAVQFWTDALTRDGKTFPIETQVATIGESTASAAEAA